MKVHVVKCQRKFFDESWNRAKPFEIRRDDRAYEPGDILASGG